MADDTALRQTALQFALEIADLCEDDVFHEGGVADTTTEVLAAADRIFEWLTGSGKPVELVMDVGPVTEQP